MTQPPTTSSPSPMVASLNTLRVLKKKKKTPDSKFALVRTAKPIVRLLVAVVLYPYCRWSFFALMWQYMFFDRLFEFYYIVYWLSGPARGFPGLRVNAENYLNRLICLEYPYRIRLKSNLKSLFFWSWSRLVLFVSVKARSSRLRSRSHCLKNGPVNYKSNFSIP